MAQERKLREDRDYFDKNRAKVRVALDRQKAFSQQVFTEDMQGKKKTLFAHEKDAFSQMSLEDLIHEAWNIDETVWSGTPARAKAFLSALGARIVRCGGFSDVISDPSEYPDDIG
ncbi:hypothetical protein COU15_02165 [Candidatus Kaiserbacteria bacterium CG10_big_fil_rev_8_21_14_0_10_45_20]|uniref:Uncharacterized protein n=1 Tax=Candidatus Kaiserbacteria bacterium CG10_big_fil_rev_8_21_14_0_10_45_20 TaxID=1974607 RepID=A0A2H0UFP6_9BACT|nr:MAG: hypothetical protein COU15_02165 [Candidatus Kaiserbacteria bacterium CG10_big_fil_rev_8_21_14_0_10_45_20]